MKEFQSRNSELGFYSFSDGKAEASLVTGPLPPAVSVTGNSTDRGLVLKTRYLLGQNAFELKGVCSWNEG